MKDLTALDWIGAIVAALTGVELIAAPWALVGPIVPLYDGFEITLPFLTNLAVRPWTWVLAGLVALAAVAASVAAPLSLGGRRAAIVGAFVFGLGASALLWVGLYLPIIEMSRAIQ